MRDVLMPKSKRQTPCNDGKGNALQRAAAMPSSARNGFPIVMITSPAGSEPAE